MGGGVFLDHCTNVAFVDVLIKENWCGYIESGDECNLGGGILFNNSTANMLNVIITNNHGSGIYFRRESDSSYIELSNVAIKYNLSHGIYTGTETKLNFDPINRCNIYFNSSSDNGKDIFSCTDSIIAVIVDTFTVLNPDNSHAYPLNKFTFDIKNAGVTNISENPTPPSDFALSQNYPNPFNPVTIISYQLPMTNDVEISIYNLLGQRVATLVNNRQKAGYHQVEWDASGFASGVYYYRIQAGDFNDMKKMMILK
jgi:hypothetical protein